MLLYRTCYDYDSYRILRGIEVKMRLGSLLFVLVIAFLSSVGAAHLLRTVFDNLP